MPLLSDLAENHYLREVSGALEIVRVYRVSGMLSSPELQLLEARNFAGVPDFGDSYPGGAVNDRYIVRAKDVYPDGPNAARVEVTYSDRPGNTWFQPDPSDPDTDGLDVKQFSSALKATRVITDRTGTVMEIPAPLSVASWPPYIAATEMLRPVATLEFERVETAAATARARTYFGAVNEFALGTTGQWAVRTLLFARFNSRSDDGGRRWRNSYAFSYDPDTWDHEDIYHGLDGKPIVDDPPTKFEIYALADFSALALDWDDEQVPI